MSVPHQPRSQVSEQPGLKILFKPLLLSPSDTLFVCSVLSLPMIFWTVLFLPDLHPVSRALKVHVDVETGVKTRSHRRHASDGLEYISRFFSRWIKQIWYDDVLSEMYLVRFGKAVAPVSSSLQNAFYRMTDFSFCKKRKFHHTPRHLSSLICPSSRSWRSPKSGGTVVSKRIGLVLVFKPPWWWFYINIFHPKNKGKVSKYVFVQHSSCKQ